MRKKDALTVDLLMLNVTAKLNYRNSVSVAINALKRLFGKHRTIESIADNTGLNCGSLKAITFANYVTCQDTANQLLCVSKTIGLCNRLQRNKIIKMLNTLFTMQHTSTRMVVLSIL